MLIISYDRLWIESKFVLSYIPGYEPTLVSGCKVQNNGSVSSRINPLPWHSLHFREFATPNSTRAKTMATSAEEMMSDQLFDLPFDLLIEILSIWVDLRSLVRTVSACCRLDLQSTLKSTFQSPAFILDHNYSSRNTLKDKSFQWLCKYGIRSTDITIDPGFLLADYMKYILRCGKLIKRIRFKRRDTVNPTFISLETLHCSQLSLLEFDGCCVWGFIGDLLNKARRSSNHRF